MNNKATIGFVLLALAAFAARGETTWIGGDQSATPGSMFHVNANWSTGVAPISTTTEAIRRHQEAAHRTSWQADSCLSQCTPHVGGLGSGFRVQENTAVFA